MVQESLLYHAVIIKIFIWFLIFNLAVPLLFKKSSIAGIKVVRMTAFIHFALLTMVAFTGLILYMLGDIPWNIEMSLMVIVFVLLSIIEAIRIRRVKKLWIDEKSMVATSAMFVSLEILLVVGIIILVALNY